MKEWSWALEVNVWGVIHGMRTFVPILLGQREEACIVNTASRAGLTSGWGVYGTTKHAVVAISESLSAQLQMIAPRIGVCVLCPSAVKTRIMNSGRNRPPRLRDEGVRAPTPGTDLMRRYRRLLRERSRAGKEPSEVAERVLEAMKKREFYILTSSDEDRLIRARIANILARRAPAPPALP